MKKKKKLNWFCAKTSLAKAQHTQCILNRNWSEPIFICNETLYFATQRADSIRFFIVHQASSVATVLHIIKTETSFWRNNCTEGVPFLFILMFSFSLWSSTAPYCLKNFSLYIKDRILRSFNPWLWQLCYSMRYFQSLKDKEKNHRGKECDLNLILCR